MNLNFASASIKREQKIRRNCVLLSDLKSGKKNHKEWKERKSCFLKRTDERIKASPHKNLLHKYFIKWIKKKYERMENKEEDDPLETEKSIRRISEDKQNKKK